MFKLASLLLMLPTLALADGAASSLNSVPLFYSALGSNPQYRDAAFKAQQAFFVQTGISPAVDKVAAYTTTKTSTTIDSNTPLDSKSVMFVGAAVYATCVRKQVVQKFHDPFFPTVTHTIMVGKDSASAGLQFPFPF